MQRNVVVGLVIAGLLALAGPVQAGGLWEDFDADRAGWADYEVEEADWSQWPADPTPIRVWNSEDWVIPGSNPPENYAPGTFPTPNVDYDIWHATGGAGNDGGYVTGGIYPVPLDTNDWDGIGNQSPINGSPPGLFLNGTSHVGEAVAVSVKGGIRSWGPNCLYVIFSLADGSGYQGIVGNMINCGAPATKHDVVQVGDGDTWTRVVLPLLAWDTADPNWLPLTPLDLTGGGTPAWNDGWGRWTNGLPGTPQDQVEYVIDNYTSVAMYGVGPETCIDDLAFVEPGDANADGIVNVGDLAILASKWQQNPLSTEAWVSADFNVSGTVDVGDLALLASHWQNNSRAGGGANVPEPITLTLLAGGAMGVLLRRRR